MVDTPVAPSSTAVTASLEIHLFQNSPVAHDFPLGTVIHTIAVKKEDVRAMKPRLLDIYGFDDQETRLELLSNPSSVPETTSG